MHLRLVRHIDPPVLGYGARLDRGALVVELLSVHEQLPPGPLLGWLYPDERAITVSWPGLRPGVHLRKRLIVED